MLHIAMISTGEEVLHGDIVDTNAAWLSRLLFEQGFAMTRRITVGDQLEVLAEELVSTSLRNDIVIVNGGLGPTTDDLTAQAAAVAANLGLEQSDYWVEQMLLKYQKLGREMPQSNLKQAMLPEGAELLENPVGTACGFAMKLNRAILYFTPGVPSEFKQMIHDEILPRMKQQYPENTALRCHRFHTFGLSESGIGESLTALSLPQGCEIGYRSSLPFIEVKLFAEKAHKQAQHFHQQMIDVLADHVVSVEQSLIENIGQRLAADKLTLTVAEQFTSGYVTNWMQETPESRAQCQQGWVLAGQVDESNSDQLAAVLAMASGARERSQTNVALASGMCIDGSVAIALATPQGDWAQTVKTKREYSHNAHRTMIATVMLDMLRRWLEHKDVLGEYGSLERTGEIFLAAHH
ncbi:CinA family nicotinamide mononucleotide deamidase-related protein [Photobacterium sanguinicancri]|uniref:CinA family nicotinamide mononucleotide deamidase-related protein n=1 Tax=Photobacterium sanguinicancri TaxID=875932 RepID=UPI002480B988|nr:CinA family nicotinamide mononucleotide deamidase-related protein [Photobacterium sanguinicancri]